MPCASGIASVETGIQGGKSDMSRRKMSGSWPRSGMGMQQRNQGMDSGMYQIWSESEGRI